MFLRSTQNQRCFNVEFDWWFNIGKSTLNQRGYHFDQRRDVISTYINVKSTLSVCWDGANRLILLLYFRFFFYISVLFRKRKWHKLGVWQKHSLKPIVIPILNMVGEMRFCYFRTSFLMAYMTPFWGTKNKCQNKINYFRMVGTGRVNKVFSVGIFINILKNNNKNETCFYKCTFQTQFCLCYSNVV